MVDQSAEAVMTTVLDINKNNLFKCREFPKDVNLQKGINRLSYGMFISKIKKPKKSQLQQVCLYIHDEDTTKLQYISSIKEPKKSKIDLLSVTSVSDSLSVPLHKKLKQYNSLLLTVFYGSAQELLLIFKTLEEKMEWWAGLEYFIKRAHDLKKLKPLNTGAEMARNYFEKADQDDNRSLDKNEIKKILKKMQISIDNKTLEARFNAFDHDKNGTFDMKEFEKFVQYLLRKPELLGLFKQYAKAYNGVDDQPVMTAAELAKFYKQEQKVDLAEQEAENIISRLKNNSVTPLHRDYKQVQKVSFYDFGTLIFSDLNLAFKSEHHGVYQDMTRPLTDYYMKSSHNTYLVGNQLTSASSIKGYIRALELGCRSVEIDLWNGDNAEPVVTHGHTLTSKIFFKDLVVALKEHAFVRSDYPLVLSFEMHCDLKGQQKILNILEAELKDQIYVLPPDYHTLPYYPSPETLRRKFLIKSKGTVPKKNTTSLFTSQLRQSFTDPDLTDLSPDCDEPFKDLSAISREFYREVKLPEITDTTSKLDMTSKILPDQSSPINTQQTVVVENRITFNPLAQNTAFAENRLTFQPNTQRLDTNNGIMNTQQRVEIYTLQTQSSRVETEDVKITEDGKKKKSHKVKSYDELAKYYAMFGSKLKFEPTRSIWEICSLGEEKIKTLTKSNARKLVDFCKKYFVRAYPAGSRIDSSNYDPVKAWAAGAQMVALNYQTPDEPMLLNWAKFAANGGTGYVLKPEYLTSAALTNKSLQLCPHEFTNPKLKIRIKIISGQQFQFEENVSTSDIIDPYVEVKVKGLDVDETMNQIYKTHTIKNNGFNPVWSDQEKSCEVSFTLIAPELATLVVKVFDADLTKRSKLAWYAIEVPHLAEGYRVFPMLNSRFDQITHSYLFVHIQIERLDG